MAVYRCAIGLTPRPALLDRGRELRCSDEDAWPTPLSFELFEEWFEIHFSPLVQDLCGAELEVLEVDEEFVEQVPAVLQQRPDLGAG